MPDKDVFFIAIAGNPTNGVFGAIASVAKDIDELLDILESTDDF